MIRVIRAAADSPEERKPKGVCKTLIIIALKSVQRLLIPTDPVKDLGVKNPTA